MIINLSENNKYSKETHLLLDYISNLLNELKSEVTAAGVSECFGHIETRVK